MAGKEPEKEEQDEVAAREWYERKSRLLEKTLGKEHNMVMHAIIPFAIGGGLDLYYYPNLIPGTAIATKELADSLTEGSTNKLYDVYELVMFTKHPFNLDYAKDNASAFGKAHANMNAILNLIARYSSQAKLNPNETCEFPAEMKNVGGNCLIFDDFAFHEVDGKSFGLLAIIEIFRSEMDFARRNGGAQLIELLRTHGHYPYSDLDRKPVV